MSQSVIRKPTNLSLNVALVAEAREMKVNLSRFAEEGIARGLAAEKARLWKEENKEAIESWNRHFEENGLPLKPLWEF